METCDIPDEHNSWDGEAAYLAVRRAEGRLLDDDQVRRLPEPPDAAHAWEWRIRGYSAERLLRRLQRRAPSRILDLGCGNGWLSRLLAELSGARVTGLDLNREELAQAARLFGSSDSPRFVCGDLFAPIFELASFDVAVLAAVIQYFPDPKALVRRLLALLAPGGEIHILDSPLYPRGDVAAAAARTRAYFRNLNLPFEPAYYHHHARADLDAFRPRCLHEPGSLKTRFLRRLTRRPLSPFPWLCIVKK